MLKHLPTRPRLATQGTIVISIVASSYNEELVEPMVERTLREIQLIDPSTKIEVVHTPGSFEIPFLAAQVIRRRKPDAVICLGVILRGETSHADFVAASVSDTLCRLSVETNTPVIHGVLLLDDESQAQERCLGEEFNRGTEAVRTAIEIIRESRGIVSR